MNKEQLREQIRAFHHVKKERWNVFIGGLVIGALVGATIVFVIMGNIIVNMALQSNNMEDFKPVPRFNDHGSTCKGHANHMLDCTYEKKEDRERLVSILDRIIEENEEKLKSNK